MCVVTSAVDWAHCVLPLSSCALKGAEISAWREVNQNLPSAFFVPGILKLLYIGYFPREKEVSKKQLLPNLNLVGTRVLSVLPILVTVM